MSDDLYPVSGMRFFIGGVKDTKNGDFIASDFSAESWVEVDGWETVGSFGDNAQAITVSLVNRGRDVTLKGTANAGQMQNNFAILRSDPGQIALIAAADAGNKSNYAFKVLGNDAPSSGPSPSPSIQYFVGLAMSASEQGGTANTARMMQATIQINSNIVTVPATTGA
jgi:hypothetical protein